MSILNTADKLLEKIVDSFPADCMEDSNIDNGENGKVDPLKRMPMSLVACLKVPSMLISMLICGFGNKCLLL